MGRKRNHNFIIRLTNEELEKLNVQVAKAGLTREAYVRSILMNSEVPNPMPPETFHTVIFHLRHIGNNLNQIARVANQSGEIDKRQYKENVKSLNEKILEIRKLVIEKNK